MKKYYEQDMQQTFGPLTNFQDVYAFSAKYGLADVIPPEPGLLTPELYRFRVKFMYEELNEFVEAQEENGDVYAAIDALIDLVYVAMGTAVLMGVPWQQCWDEVQRANMAKVRATDASQSKRGSAYDVVKPEGWRPPDHAAVVRRVLEELPHEA